MRCGQMTSSIQHLNQTYLQLGDLDADVEELTGSLNVGIVAAGDLVLAGEARLWQPVRGIVGWPHLGVRQARQQA